MDRLDRIPLLVTLIAAGAVAMMVPAMVALSQDDFETARPFAYASVLFLSFSIVLGFATSATKTGTGIRQLLVILLVGFIGLPVMLAIPFAEAVPDTRFINAYVEMISSLTTTGATLFDAERLPLALHIWRALVAWMGGFMMWVVAFALLAPMTLGGFEVTSVLEAGRGQERRNFQDDIKPFDRLSRYFWRFLPVYVGLTGLLWLGLVLTGDTASVAVIHAMSTLSTSGITSLDTFETNLSGVPGEVLILFFLVFAVSRRTFIGGLNNPPWHLLRRDRELRIALMFITIIPLFLFIRHWLAAWQVDEHFDMRAWPAVWGGIFTVGSFMTTTGFISGSWADAQHWSGLETPGVLMAGLAITGGGVATTAGGVKLLRVYALYKHGLREMERLVHPSSVGGSGEIARRIRTEGAEIAWVFFMLFAISVALVMTLLSITGLTFEECVILAVAALSNTGPVATIAPESPISFATLPDASKLILSGAMVLGRLETLVIIALLNPNFWRS